MDDPSKSRAEPLLPEPENGLVAATRRLRRKSNEDITTLYEERPAETDDSLLKQMPAPAWQRHGWPTKRMVLGLRACVIGLAGGAISACYHGVLESILEVAWKQSGPAVIGMLGLDAVPWLYIPMACVTFGTCTGLLIKCLGAPTANLPGVVLEVNRDGRLSNDVHLMLPISITSIMAAGSLGPEAPLISIGGGLASSYALWCRLNAAEALTITMCGMGAGLAAFFGDPVGGALFACEVLHRNGLEYFEALIPTVTAGLASNFAFRTLLGIESNPVIWHFPLEKAPVIPDSPPAVHAFALLVVHAPGLTFGCMGAAIAVLWMTGFNRAKRMLEPYAKHHLTKAVVGSVLIGLIGALAPCVLFWGEQEAQWHIDGSVELSHVWPQTGLTGSNLHELGAAGVLGAALLKLLAIAITILAGYRGGFIFPFMNAGIGIGAAIAAAAPPGTVSLGAAALALAAAMNTAVTRTVVATPLVLTSLTGRVDLFPTILTASIVSLHLSSHVAVITCAQPRGGLADNESPERRF